MSIHSINSAVGAGNAELATLAANRQPLAPRVSSQDTPELRQTFDQFVGQTFFGELIKQMRASVGKPALVHGGFGEDVFQSQLDQILVERISESSAETFSEPMYRLLMSPRS